MQASAAQLEIVPRVPRMSTGKVVPIHTSDRGLYRTCRRRWLLGSHLNYGLEPVSKAAPLWYGEAFHFALKDYHGNNLFGSPLNAFYEYAALSQAQYADRLPPEFPDLMRLAPLMFEHYDRWLERRDPLTTYLHNGLPQVEVAFEIEVPIDRELLDRLGIEKVVYRGTFDRIIIDQYGHLWIVEYKTAARFETGHLATDAQVTAYSWAAQCLYELPVMGVIYQQHKKDVPKPARILLRGGVSTAKNQLTSHRLYREALLKVYGTKEQGGWTNEHIEMLNRLATMETVHSDRWIQRTYVDRNYHQLVNEGRKIILEVTEMLDPRTPMYSAPGWNCGFCPFQSPCTSMDDGSDYEHELNDERMFRRRTKASSEWEIISEQRLGGILYHANAEVIHDRAGAPSKPEAVAESIEQLSKRRESTTGTGTTGLVVSGITAGGSTVPSENASDAEWSDWLAKFGDRDADGSSDAPSEAGCF